MKIKTTDIVKFRADIECEGGLWCWNHNITGKVVSIEGSRLQVDVGLYYNIYAYEKHVEFVVHANQAPIPDE